MAVILLIDDERSVVKLVSTVLGSLGHQVLAASNGLEGLAIFRSDAELIDLVITDMQMPVLDGYELVGRIQETNPDARIICMSGYFNQSGPPRVMFLRKPFQLEELKGCVREMLSNPRS
jgi:two-component system cell cycle sensor histidine kinase/response regulator CckA